jgi:HNH endonuclease
MPSESDYISPSLRSAVKDRAHNHCEYCVCPADYSPDSFTIDHTLPRQSGGLSTFDNLAWACQGCNGSKHIKTSFIDPETQEEIPLFNPRSTSWNNHFQWSPDFTQMMRTRHDRCSKTESPQRYEFTSSTNQCPTTSTQLVNSK